MGMSDDRRHEYEVCLSFAGEQRHYVEKVAAGLKKADVAIFYDEFDQVNLWGKNLYEHLDWVYRRSARYCILFASADYARKNWTNHERRSAQARALEGRAEYVLPVRFDNSDIPGLLPTVSYIDGTETPPEDLVSLVLLKLGRTQAGEIVKAKPWSVPRNDAERARLLAEKPPMWEFLLFGAELLRAMGRFEPMWGDHEIRYVNPTLQKIDSELDYLQDSFDFLTRTVSNLGNILSPQAQDAAFGLPGVAGDAGRIAHLAERLVQIYGDLLTMAAKLRSAKVSPDFARAYWIASYAADRPLWELRHFFFKIVEDFDQASITIHTQPETRIVLEANLTLTLDERVMDDFNAELKRVGRRLRRRR
jgi:hypothetical protein